MQVFQKMQQREVKQLSIQTSRYRMVRFLELSLSMYHIVGVEDVSASNTEKA